jgi:predicted TIM-barrel fold metal-dependent hydrolase
VSAPRAEIVDAHAHVWRSVPDHADPTATIVSPVADVPVSLLTQYMEEYGVDRAVLIQPICAGEDNSYIADAAAAQAERFAAVCAVDPRRPDATERLAFWVRERGCRGVRFRPRKHDEEASFASETAHRLWALSEELGLVVSVYAGPGHLSVLAEFARRFPEITIVVDHFAHPDPREAVAGEGFRRLLDLAVWPRVYVKVSGYHHFSMEPYPYADCWPLFRAIHAEYGAERLLWGSDFPHVLLICGYRRNLRLHERVHDFLAPSDLEAIMGGNSLRLYWEPATSPRS